MKILESHLTQQDIEQLVFREYDFFPHKVEMHDSTRKIVCDRGTFALKETTASLDQLHVLGQVFIHLKEEKFTHMVPFIRNKFGDSCVSIENKNYYVTPWIDDIVEEKYRDQWEMRVARGLGKLHASTLLLREKLGEENRKGPLLTSDGLLKRWKARLHEMSQYKDFAENRELMSPVELTFVNQYRFLSELGLRSIKYLKQWEEKVKDSLPLRTVLCHGQIYRKNVLHDHNQFYFIHFDQAHFDTPVRDVALFLRRHIGKMLDQEEEYAMNWLEEYEKEFPLLREERLLLAIYLLFPERVFKEIEVYYQGIRDWHPMKQMKFFEKQIQLTHQIRRLVRLLIAQDE